jgi:hypothetical protein
VLDRVAGEEDAVAVGDDRAGPVLAAFGEVGEDAAVAGEGTVGLAFIGDPAGGRVGRGGQRHQCDQQ